MKKSLIPIKYAFIILAIYQLYSIFVNWGHDGSKVAISVAIFIGCTVMIFVERLLTK
ncbi:hypothetical protein [Ureibacillus sinduriensis]|uniref:hypothetical protein n=1 Tax=Ureibacillus sinduriensis TaxID=561440 RepID=UPI000A7A1C40|nr:hypothetical protein [Ureibacillus sinduriensis]